MRRFSLLILVLSLVLAAGSAFAVNLLVNPGFEDGFISPWSDQGNCTLNTAASYVRTGIQSVGCTPRTNSAACRQTKNWKPLDVGDTTDNKMYRLKAYMYFPGNPAPSTGKIIRFGRGIKNIGDSGTKYSATTFTITKLDSWEQYTTEWLDFPSVELTNVQFGCEDKTTSSTLTPQFYVDDTELEVVDKPKITASAGTGGSISPSGDSYIMPGLNSQTYNIIATAPAVVSDVKVDNVSQGPITSYQFTNVTSDHTITATFTVPPVSDVTRYEAENGTFVNCQKQSFTGASPSGSVANNLSGKSADGAYGSTTLSISVAQAGLYDLTLGYKGFGDNRYTRVSVNGVNLPGSPFLCNAGVLATKSIPSVPLNAGTNTIVLYENAGGWGPHWDYIDVPKDPSGAFNTITATAGTGGTITPAGSVAVAPGSDATFTIAPTNGYKIADVVVDAGTGGENRLGAVTTYTFSNVTTSHTINATFSALPSYTITATAGAGGTVTPAGVTTLFQGQSQTYTIKPNFGYDITDVVVDNSTHLGAVTTYTFSDVNTAHTIDATFTLKPLVNVSGNVSIGSVLTENATVSCYSDAACKNLLTSFSTGSGASYTLALTQNTTYYMRATKSGFGPSAPVPVVVAGVDVPGQDIAITLRRYEAENAVLKGCRIFNDPIASGGNRVEPLDQAGWDTATFTVYAQTGSESSMVLGYYQVWDSNRDTFLNVNGVAQSNIPGANTAGGYGTVSKTITLAAGLNSVVLSNGTGWGPHWDYIDIPQVSYVITASAGSNGAISPSGNMFVAPDGSQTYTITPITGYLIDQVLIDGVNNPAAASGSYTFTGVRSDHTISATFKKMTFTITASAGEGGSISPSNAVVDYDTGKTFTITPSTGYVIDDVKVDGNSVGAVSSYEFKNVTAAHEISATFKKMTLTITASAGDGGSISPSGAVSVEYGKSKTFAITANLGYIIKDVEVNGISQGPLGSYTFDNVTSDNSIAASFTDTCIFIPAAKATAEGETVNLRGQIVTAVFGDSFYIEETAVPSGIRVFKSGNAMTVGSKIQLLTGLIKTDDQGEMYIDASSVATDGNGAIEPVGLNTKALGGADGVGRQVGVKYGEGTNNIGLLVRVLSGRVTAISRDFFYIDDGFGANDGSVFRGIRVKGAAPQNLQRGNNVTVTGISSIMNIGGNYFRCLKPLGITINP